MRNPFKRKSVPIDSLLAVLFVEIDELAVMIEELRKDLQDLTDFVEDNLD
jgi:hypothetical protein